MTELSRAIHAAMLAIAKREPLPTVQPLIVTEADNIPCRCVVNREGEGDK